MKKTLCAWLFLGTFPLSAYMSPTQTPVVEFLKPITLTQESSGIDHIDCVYVINLDERPERWDSIVRNFSKYNIKPNRVSAINGWKIPAEDRETFVTSKRMHGGQVGCFLSHLSIYQDAVLRDFDVVWVCEDDLEMRENVLSVSHLLQELTEIDPGWDILYTDYASAGSGDQRPRKGQPPYKAVYKPVSESLLSIRGRYGTHSMIYSKSGLRKAINYFFHVYLFSPIDIDVHYIPSIREYTVRKPITTLAEFPSDVQVKSVLNKPYP